MSMSGWMVRTSVCQCPTAERPMPIEGSYLYENAERTNSHPANRLHMYAGGAESGGSPRRGRGGCPHSPTTGPTPANRPGVNDPEPTHQGRYPGIKPLFEPPSCFRQILVRACHHTTPRFLPSGGHPPAAHKDSHRRAAQRH